MSVKVLDSIPPSPPSSMAMDDQSSGNTLAGGAEQEPAAGHGAPRPLTPPDGALHSVTPPDGAQRSAAPPDGAQRRYTAPSKALASVRDIFISPVVGSLLTIGLLALCTWWILWLREFTQYERPYTILYLIPVAIGAAFLGLRGGVAASAAALLLTRVYLLNDHKHGWALASSTNIAEGLEFTTLTMGTLAIAAVTGRLRKTLGSLHASHIHLQEINERLSATNSRLIDSENQRRTFNSEVLLAVTGGKLNLVERADILPRELAERTPAHTQPLKVPLDASCLRQDLHQLALTLHMEIDRTADLLTSVSEAATNAIKHGGGGAARLWLDDSLISVLIEDTGTGIAPVHLARATLEAGYSTRISLGMGFHLMLEAADTLTLSTSEQGTAILLQISNKPRISEEDAILAKYMRA